MKVEAKGRFIEPMRPLPMSGPLRRGVDRADGRLPTFDPGPLNLQPSHLERFNPIAAGIQLE
jgi:hypothetical protein